MKSFLAIFLFALFSMPLAAQTPTYDELEFELDSITNTYKPIGKNSVLIKSKRGTGGLNRTPAGDAIRTAEVTEIVLVFSETESADIEEREEANAERWENLLMTYPEYFQFSTTYKTLCQCNLKGDADAFKSAQGFYIYINGDVPKTAAPKEEPKVAESPVAKTTKPTEDKPAKTTKIEEKKIENTPQPEILAATSVAEPDKTAVKEKETPAVTITPIAKETKEQNTSAEPEVVKVKPAKKVGVSKARKTKDPKACRMACYENGQESLDAFLKDNIKLSKKERRKAKKLEPVARIQLNIDGSIKKVMVTCPDEKMNLMLTEAFKSMNPWNATVKSGVTVKSEVKLTLKFDKKAKTFKAFEVAVTPRLAPKCKCASDSELF